MPETQEPWTHAWLLPHVTPHAPQFWLSTCVFTQAAAHSVVPPGQGVHEPPWHDGAPAPQEALQAPQCLGSESRSAQVAPQSVRGGAHAQTPWSHAVPGLQAWPQPPQWAGSDSGYTHQRAAEQ